ncbi:unnamed protein product [Ranitomeya imitator]|uniref:Uncharacterized protein n=1 Tax=Ranitomeya imitator TaxID=111125 RepID=A0ABN9MES7_9NEOB|nr:unnamed protein product [Ranitomeya imitator]
MSSQHSIMMFTEDSKMEIDWYKQFTKRTACLFVLLEALGRKGCTSVPLVRLVLANSSLAFLCLGLQNPVWALSEVGQALLKSSLVLQGQLQLQVGVLYSKKFVYRMLSVMPMGQSEPRTLPPALVKSSCKMLRLNLPSHERCLVPMRKGQSTVLSSSSDGLLVVESRCVDVTQDEEAVTISPHVSCDYTSNLLVVESRCVDVTQDGEAVTISPHNSNDYTCNLFVYSRTSLLPESLSLDIGQKMCPASVPSASIWPAGEDIKTSLLPESLSLDIGKKMYPEMVQSIEEANPIGFKETLLSEISDETNPVEHKETLSSEIPGDPFALSYFEDVMTWTLIAIVMFSSATRWQHKSSHKLLSRENSLDGRKVSYKQEEAREAGLDSLTQSVMLLLAAAFLVAFVLLLYMVSPLISPKPLKLAGAHVVVTGGSSGIGKCIAVECFKQGAFITLVARDELIFYRFQNFESADFGLP